MRRRSSTMWSIFRPRALPRFLLAVAALFHGDADFQPRRRDGAAEMPTLIARPMPDGPRLPWPARLALRLSGPRVYHGALTDDEWIGEGREEANSADIRRALELYKTACTVQIAALGLLALVIALL